MVSLSPPCFYNFIFFKSISLRELNCSGVFTWKRTRPHWSQYNLLKLQILPNHNRFDWRPNHNSERNDKGKMRTKEKKLKDISSLPRCTGQSTQKLLWCCLVVLDCIFKGQSNQCSLYGWLNVKIFNIMKIFLLM